MAESFEDGIELTPGVVLPPAGFWWQFSRSSGPGGQNVNKLSTRATLVVPIAALAELLPAHVLRRLTTLAARRIVNDELHLSAQDSRSQFANRLTCARRLAELVEQAHHAPKPRRRTRPTKASIRRRLDGKKQRSERKDQRRRPSEPGA